MAVNYRTITVGNNQYDVIVVEESGTSQRLIFRHLLNATDLTNMDLVEDNGTGATFLEKLQSYTLPNGRNAEVQYRPLIHNTTEYSKELGRHNFTPTQVPIIGNSGTFETSLVESDRERHYLSIRFYDSSDQMIAISSITDGTVTISASETPDAQYEVVTNGTIAFSGTAGYQRPTMAGSYSNLRIVLNGLTSTTPIAYATVLMSSFQ